MPSLTTHLAVDQRPRVSTLAPAKRIESLTSWYWQQLTLLVEGLAGHHQTKGMVTELSIFYGDSLQHQVTSKTKTAFQLAGLECGSCRPTVLAVARRTRTKAGLVVTDGAASAFGDWIVGGLPAAETDLTVSSQTEDTLRFLQLGYLLFDGLFVSAPEHVDDLGPGRAPSQALAEMFRQLDQFQFADLLQGHLIQ